MRGYIKDHRQELVSDIWKMPPLYHRVWQWLKYKVNYEDAVIPFADGSKLTINAGQHLTSIRKIAAGVGWYERGLWKEPNPKTISEVLKWLENDGMITVDGGNSKYTLITLVNWRFFQQDELTKVTVSAYKEKELRTKELKELSSLKDMSEMEVQNPMQILNPKLTFEEFYAAYPRKVSRQPASKAWDKLEKQKDFDPAMIIRNTFNYAETCKLLGTQPNFILHPSTYLNQKRYEDYATVDPEGLAKGKPNKQMDVLANFYKEGADEETGNGAISGGSQNGVPALRNN
ncbi:hypothetical protein [Paenibacillus harenae]|uniref:hypothetical protein n=1 Tax=Paenibacillus harenae TaxID=306543 RepID=UPI000410F02C|nr:hypothetical protein [Paenibacillus harenae]